MDKVERRFSAWVDAHEKELTILMNNPEKWRFCEKYILPGNEPVIKSTLEGFLTIQDIINSKLESPINKMLVTLEGHNIRRTHHGRT